ncbi:hypothetical protein RM572_25555 [Streptomyces sp. DSM 42041]|uniref:Uncharacterized protein n=1 Tax=Streptomyces hazeniae TaxID=3075538 RepID=A0ABU2P039_9ACTN|nr:hypothetical protein [Streptomyces sp. DSM 42041]MDT0382132.1 hypothetical protein [Streptomyces sp. DSM 42041]
MKERTVGFYEIVTVKAGEARRIPELMDWDGALADLSRAPVEGRSHEGDSHLVGSVRTYHMQDHLLLHRVKDAGEWLSVLNFDTGHLRELEQTAQEGYLDTSVICFLSFGNVVGIMQGGVSAPSHKGLETWLNGIGLFPGSQLQLRPVVAHSEIEKLKTASGASRVEVKVMANKLGALSDRRGGLARTLHVAGESYGEISVTMIISVPKKKVLREHRERLLADLEEISDVVTGAERARARLVYSDPGGPEHTRLVELVEHSITAKKRVPATDAEGNSIRIMSAVDAILGAAAEHEDALRLAVDAGDL